MPRRTAYEFPRYTAGERIADMLIHAVGIAAGASATVWLLVRRAPQVSQGELLSLIVYGAALNGMLLASTSYNLARPGWRKERLRCVDHAMIFLMIAGTYTPFAAGHDDTALLGPVWAAALAGAGFTLAFPRRFERIRLILYVALGWAILAIAAPIGASLPALSMMLLCAGGVLYTVGTAVHLAESAPYHNAVWHALVLIAAGCHFAAVVANP